MLWLLLQHNLGYLYDSHISNPSPPILKSYVLFAYHLLYTNKKTTDNIFILCAIIDTQRCLSKPLYTCFRDFTKAFDYIDRSALYYKLLSREIDGFFFKFNKEYVL